MLTSTPAPTKKEFIAFFTAHSHELREVSRRRTAGQSLSPHLAEVFNTYLRLTRGRASVASSRPLTALGRVW